MTKIKKKSGIVLEEYEKGYTFHDKVLEAFKSYCGRIMRDIMKY